jgi:hypothetical protein
MNVEYVFNKVPEFKNAKLDRVLFEGEHPILFTMEKSDIEYLFCCPVADATEIVWIGTETDAIKLIDMLNDKITIRDAFTQGGKIKYIVRQRKSGVSCEKLADDSFPEEYLPSAGEYMESEPGEFDEEIGYYLKKAKYRSFVIAEKSWNVFILPGTRARAEIDISCVEHDMRWCDGYRTWFYDHDNSVMARIGG